MELTIEQLMQGKATRIKDKEYFTTEAYVTPFINRVSKMTDNFIINAKPADQISLTKDGEINFDDVIYNRVWIQGVLPNEYAWDNHKRVISRYFQMEISCIMSMILEIWGVKWENCPRTLREHPEDGNLFEKIFGRIICLENSLLMGEISNLYGTTKVIVIKEANKELREKILKNLFK